MIKVFIDDHKFINQVRYVFMIIKEVTGVDFEVISEKDELNEKDIIIAYVKNIKNLGYINNICKKIIIENSNKLFGDNYLDKKSIPNQVLRHEVDGEADIVSIYNSSDELYIENSGDIIHTNMDIIADIFFMLTRYEEIVNRDVMEYETYKRFPAKESLAFKFNFLNRAVVNEQIELILSWIIKLDDSIKKSWHWGNSSFAACLTHDVDWIQKHNNIKSVLRSAAAQIIKHKSISNAIKDFNTYVKSTKNYKDDMYWTFKYIIDSEKYRGFTSSFYFMTGGNTNFDNNYSYDDYRIRELAKELGKNGFECGYHGSFNSYNNEEMMKLEKSNLDKVLETDVPYGMRQHYLRFLVPETWRIQKKCGFLYDSTLGYADSIGFRAGFCYPYKPYDILNNEIMNVWEIPLIVMESSLMKNDYSSCTPEEAYRSVIALIDTIKKHNGVFTFLWHNSSFDSTKEHAIEWKKVYEDILEYLASENCTGISGREVIRLYNEKILDRDGSYNG